jgi:hypothetical protein
MAETIHLMGEGGAVFEYDLPLPRQIEKQWANQSLVQVDEDGVPTEDQYEEFAAEDEDEPEDGQGGEDGSQDGSVPKPAKAGPGSSREAWAAYARSVDHDLTEDEAAQMDRTALIEKYDH